MASPAAREPTRANCSEVCCQPIRRAGSLTGTAMTGPNHPNGVTTSRPAAGEASVRNLIEEGPCWPQAQHQSGGQ